MSKYTRKIVHLDGTEEIVDFTPEEIEEREKQAKEIDAYFEAKAKIESARQSALAKLAALGLTEDEIAAL